MHFGLHPQVRLDDETLQRIKTNMHVVVVADTEREEDIEEETTIGNIGEEAVIVDIEEEAVVGENNCHVCIAKFTN